MRRYLLLFIAAVGILGAVERGGAASEYDITVDLRKLPHIGGSVEVRYEPTRLDPSVMKIGLVLLLDSLAVTVEDEDGAVFVLIPFSSPMVEAAVKKTGRDLESVAFVLVHCDSTPVAGAIVFQIEFQGRGMIADDNKELPFLEAWFPIIVEMSEDNEILNVAGGRCTVRAILRRIEDAIAPLGYETVTELANGNVHVVADGELALGNLNNFLPLAIVTDIELSEDRVGDIIIKAYFTERSRRWGRQVPNLAVDVIKYYSNLFGFFPYKRVVFVSGRTDVTGGGEIAPGVLWIHKLGELGGGLYSKWIIAHELGHLYWGGIGHVQLTENWLSLGLGMWTDRKYSDYANLGTGFHSYEKYLSLVRDGKETVPLSSPDMRRRLDANTRRILEHRKGYAIVNMLEYLIGEELFGQIITGILDNYGGLAMTFEDFKTACEAVHGQSLEWYFDQWVNTTWYLDYAIADVKIEQGRIRMTVERVGKAVMPIDIRVTATDGTMLDRRWDGVAERAEVEFPLMDWDKVELDPHHWLPDVDLSNNTLVEGPQ